MKLPKGWCSESIWVDKHMEMLGKRPSLRGMKPRTPSHISYAVLPSGCSWVIPFYSKSVIEWVNSFPEFCVLLYPIKHIGEGWWNLCFMGSKWEHREQPGLVISIWEEGNLTGLNPLLWDLMLPLGRECQN